MERHKLYVGEHGDDMPEVRRLALESVEFHPSARCEMTDAELALPILALNSGSSSLKFGIVIASDLRKSKFCSPARPSRSAIRKANSLHGILALSSVVLRDLLQS